MFFMACKNWRLILVMLIISLVEALLSFQGFFLNDSAFPPRIVFVILPMLMFILWFFFTKNGRDLIQQFDLKLLMLLSSVRIPVEFGLAALANEGLVPESMSYHGRNYDILSGISAPIIAYVCLNNGIKRKALLLVWNTIALLLLLQVVITGIFSAPSPFQQLSFDQPNIAVLYFPFIWLPSIVVPIVLFSHLVVFARVLKKH